MCTKKLITFVCLALTSTSYGGVIIGDWEQQSDGWNIPSGYHYEDTIGVTLHDWSLQILDGGGWSQGLSKSLNEAQRADFLANTKFSIDVTYDSGSWDSAAGYAQVYQLSMNNGGFGWKDVGGTAAPTGMNGVVFTDTLNPGSPGNLPLVDAGTPGTVITGTWTWDYSGVLDQFTNDYIEFIFALNSDTAGAYYFDNARLTPEPTTLLLLGLGGLMLRKKR